MLRTRINGRDVRGVIKKRTAEELEVEIVSPFDHVAMNAHIPRFILSETSFENGYGDEWAEILLTHTYEMCQYTVSNIDWLAGAYIKLQQDLGALAGENLSKEESESKRFFMKMRFFHVNYPNMNVQECSWGGLLSLIRDMMGHVALRAGHQ